MPDIRYVSFISYALVLGLINGVCKRTMQSSFPPKDVQTPIVERPYRFIDWISHYSKHKLVITKD